jgi:hypothetical protein
MDRTQPHRSSGTMGPGTGIGVGLTLLSIFAVAVYAYSESLLVTFAVFVGVLAIGLLLNAGYDRYVF